MQKLLIELQEPHLVADQLLKIWNRGELKFVEQTAVCNFLFNAGFYPTLVSQLKNNFTQGIKIPWGPFLSALSTKLVTLDKEILDHILIGAAEEGALDELIFCLPFDSVDSRFMKIRTRFYESRDLSYDKKHKSLVLDDAGMRDLLKKKEQEFSLRKFNFDLNFEASPSQDIHQIAETFVQKSKETPALAYEIAIALYLMGLMKPALDAISFAPASESTDWLKIQLLLDNNLFVVALQELGSVELKYAGNPDTFSSSMVLKAKALWGLNNKVQAIEILEKVLEEQPYNFMAQALIRDWKPEI